MSGSGNRLSGSPKARFSRMVAGRLYPRFARSHLPPDEKDLSNDFTAEVERTIRTRLSFAEEAQGYRDHAKLLDDYAQSIQVIRQATQQVREMAEAAFRLNTDFRSEKRVSVKARDRFLAEHFEALSREINISLAPPSGILGAELEALPVEMAEIQLRGALDKAVHGFAMQVCDLLDRMTEPGGPKPTETLQDAVDQYDWKEILQDFGHPDYVEQGSRVRGGAPASAEGNAPDSLDEVYEQGAGRSGVGRDFGRTTTIQDAVSEPKKRGGR